MRKEKETMEAKLQGIYGVEPFNDVKGIGKIYPAVAYIGGGETTPGYYVP